MLAEVNWPEAMSKPDMFITSPMAKKMAAEKTGRGARFQNHFHKGVGKLPERAWAAGTRIDNSVLTKYPRVRLP